MTRDEDAKSTGLALPSGRAIEVESKEGVDVLRVRASSGATVLTIHLSNEGPVVRVEGASLEIAAAKKVSLDCEDLELKASRSAKISARDVAIVADTGGIDLRANDDVAIVGERVLLNSDDPPMPLTWEEYEARRVAGTTRSLVSPGSPTSPVLEAPQALPCPDREDLR